MTSGTLTRALLSIRAAAFYAGYGVITLCFGLSALLLLRWLPYDVRARYLLGWNRSILWWLRFSCGVRWRVITDAVRPDSPAVVLSNHQSEWETVFLQVHFHPIATVLKQELLNIPLFGWGMRLMKPIAIDRGAPREALREIFRQGHARIDEGMNVLVFPEGSRRNTGKRKPFAKGGASLAVSAGVPVVPVAHNAGHFWPTGRWLKYPGTITVAIGPPIATAGLKTDEVNQRAHEWIESMLEQLDR